MENKAEEPVQSYGQPLTFEKVWEMFQETSRKFRETDEKFKETDKKFKEAERIIMETDLKINKLGNVFSDQWGQLVQSLVHGDLIKILISRGIDVKKTTENFSGCVNGDNFEFDILAINTTEIVIVEVKTTLRADDVKKIIKKLHKAKEYMPEYNSMNVFGAIAFLKANVASEVMAESKGLFVIRATGSSASIINKEDFVPKKF